MYLQKGSKECPYSQNKCKVNFYTLRTCLDLGKFKRLWGKENGAEKIQEKKDVKEHEI